tara:strand:- start:1374 stop:1628 length:255 start_codon:yes stop_codon:yes gene_type:complete
LYHLGVNNFIIFVGKYMKIGDLVRCVDGADSLGIVISEVRTSTTEDNHRLGVMYSDAHLVVDIFVHDTIATFDTEELEMLSESR